MSAGIAIVYGAAPVGNSDPFSTAEDVEKLYSVLLKHNVKEIDTAQLYEESENKLGETRAGERFTLQTKWAGGYYPGWATHENIVNSATESMKKLGVKQVDIFYMHIPDSKTDISETLAGVQEAYQLGLFKRFGLSNYLTEDVQKIYDHCKEKGYILPTVYQGNYSPVARRPETLLFPTLRKLGISFYAYSPLAGGFLSKTIQQINEGVGRFRDDTMRGVYKRMYVRPTLVTALEKWAAIAEAENTTKADLAYRWVVYNSPLKAELGDGVVLGARTLEQIDQTLTGIGRGKLSGKAAKAIDEIWEDIKHEAPTDNLVE